MTKLLVLSSESLLEDSLSKPLEGAKQLIQAFKNKNYKIIALSKKDPILQDTLHSELISLGLNIDATIACGEKKFVETKKKYIQILQPDYFIDNDESSVKSVSDKTKAILISNAKPLCIKNYKYLPNFNDFSSIKI